MNWRLILMSLMGTLIPYQALAAGGGGGELPFSPYLYFFGAGVALLLTLYGALAIESLLKKILLFAVIGGITAGFIYGTGGASDVLVHVYVVDYIQFIPIPALTLLIASMGLVIFSVKDDFKPGWFLLIMVPLIGNFMTTWVMVPVSLSLYPVMRKRYPSSWLLKMIVSFIFGGNMLALLTVLADPPQAYWAVQLAKLGLPMGFFYTGSKLWIFVIFTWLLYWTTLKKLGVEFGKLNLKALLPPLKSKWKGLGAVVLCGTLAFALLELKGYEVTVFLGTVFIVGFIAAMFMGHEVRHRTIHWSVETFAIFIAFFSVVAWFHTALKGMTIADETMTLFALILTVMADNAAAFAAAYPQFAGLGNEDLMIWFALLPTVAAGSLTPPGNGPQIIFFLVVLVSICATTAKQVFIEWLKVSWTFTPYLSVWIFGAHTIFALGGEMTWFIQILLGTIAMTTSVAALGMVRQNVEATSS